MAESFVIGVDAGGTKTTAWKSPYRGNRNDDPLATGHAGPGNANSVGFEAATANIYSAIESARHQDEPVDCVCICAAGAGRTTEQERLHDWAIELNLARKVLVGTDIDALLALASENSTGVALIAGTGSLASGRNAAGNTSRCGGWGWLLGDEGSAYRIGLTALQRATRMADGREPGTPLLTAIMDRLKLDDPGDLISVVYNAANSKTTIAQLCPHVFKIAATGEEVCSEITQSAAKELAAMVQAVSIQLKLPTDHALAMTGGVLTNQPAFLGKVLSYLSRKPDQITLVQEPVRGAVELARRVVCGG